MKIIYKLLLVGAIATPCAMSAGVYIATQVPENRNVGLVEDYYELNNGTYKLHLDTEELHFTITKGTQTWDSGSIDPSDEKVTSLREAFIKGPITIYALSPSGGESNFSVFDDNHFETTEITDVTETTDSLIVGMSVLDGRRKSPNLKLTFDLVYTLKDDGLILSVKNLKEAEENTNLVSRIVIYPGFASSYQLNDGYFLIPDGSGALIDLSQKTHAQRALQLTTYGKDIGISTSSRSYTSGEQLAMPMFGISDDDKSALVTVESGQEFSDLNAKVYGMVDDYNLAYFRFLYRDVMYQYQGISETNRKTVPQSHINEFEPSVYYHLYDKPMTYADYAKEYRDYLFANQLLNDTKNGQSKMRLDFLMSENKKALFGKEIIHMTTPSYIKEVMGELFETGKDFEVSLRGYTSGGFGNSYPYTFPIESGGYESLNHYLHDNQVKVNMNVDLVRSFAGNNVPTNNLAMNISQKKINTSDYVYGTSSSFNRLSPSKTVNLLNKYEKNLNSLSADGFDFTSYGFELFSTYYNEANTRSSSMQKYIDGIKGFNHTRNMRKPNLYMFNYFESYLDAPMSSSNYMIETSDIPFLQMVLSGYKSFYSSPLNLDFMGEKQLLNLIDYNINPSFLLTEKDAMELIDSPSSSYVYSSQYSIWKDDVINSYNKVISKLSQVAGATFVNREELAPNVYKNTYDNGKAIIVNYSGETYNYSGTEVPALGSVVVNNG